ncbi:hypothetical protein GCM10010433_09580 [Streptomyces pulveraceus]
MVTDPGPVTGSGGEEPTVVGVDDPRMPPGPDGPRAQWDAQRGHGGSGALADEDIVYPRRPSDEDDDGPSVQLLEVASGGCRDARRAPDRAPLDLDTVTTSSLWPRRWSR